MLYAVSEKVLVFALSHCDNLLIGGLIFPSSFS